MPALRPLLLLLLLSPLAAAADTSARAQVEKVFATWKEGYDTKNVAKVMSIYTPDLKYSYQKQPDIGFDALKSQYVTDFEAAAPNWTWSSFTEEVHSDGKIAVAVSLWTLRTGRGADAKNIMRIRSIDMLRLGDQGWKIFRTVNYPD